MKQDRIAIAKLAEIIWIRHCDRLTREAAFKMAQDFYWAKQEYIRKGGSDED